MQFKMINAGDGAFYLQNVESGRCVHPEGGHANKNGVKLQFWNKCQGSKLQFKEIDAGVGTLLPWPRESYFNI